MTTEQIDTAIAAALLGKSITYGDRTWSSHDLKDLLELRATTAAATGTATTSRVAAFSKGC